MAWRVATAGRFSFMRRAAAVGAVAAGAWLMGAGRGEGAGEEPGVRVVPISGGLGLADIHIADPGGEFEGVSVLLRGGDGMMAVPLRWREQGGEWSGRVMAGGGDGDGDGDGTIAFEVRVRGAGGAVGERVLGPFRESARPRVGTEAPDWALGAVWYQVFPERFRNGTAANDPRGPDVTAAAWTADWGEVTADELDLGRARAMGAGRRPQARRDRGGERHGLLLARRYGGDLQGVVEKLDELADLGVTAIYLNPVFDAPSLHKYDASDFRHVDPTLGAPGGRDEHDRTVAAETQDPATWVWTASDRYLIDVLLPESRRRGMRVVLDGVWNHVGVRHWAFRDVVERGADSPYAAWFDARFAPPEGPGLDALRARHPELVIRAGMLIGWQGWNGRNGTLPEFSRTAEGRLHPEVEQHIFEVTRRWMDPDGDGDPADGIDGWRLDVAPDVPMAFWEAWRGHAKAINPDAVLIGEVWFDAKDYFGGRAFDAQMNYPFREAVLDWIAGKQGTTSEGLGARLERVFSHAPQVDLAQMNLLGSHDTARVATALAAGDGGGGRPGEEAYERALLGVAVQALYVGSPSIYYGDEYGVHGGNDPDCRKPMPWPDLGAMANADDAPVTALRDRCRAMLRLRGMARVGPVLRYGSVRHLPSGSPDVFVFERELNGERVVAAVNRGDAAVEVAALGGEVVGARSAVCRYFERGAEER